MKDRRMPKMSKEETIALARSCASCKCLLKASLAYQQNKQFDETIDLELDRLRKRVADLGIEMTKASFDVALYCESKLELDR